MQMAATLVGLVTPARSRNVELKPYAVSSPRRTPPQPCRSRTTSRGNVGGDFKYGLTRSLITDVTVNTDFAQIEEDVQQVNLTRFNVLFPEKRDFFLEGQGIYAFGGRSVAGRGAGDTDDVPVMFFSRQIGLSAGQTVPVLGGGRITGKAGRWDIAGLNIQTGEKAAARAVSTNFSALRIRRDILRRSNVGMIATLRNPSGPGDQATCHLRRRLQHSLLAEYDGAWLLRTGGQRADVRVGRQLPRELRVPGRSLWPRRGASDGRTRIRAVTRLHPADDFRRDIASLSSARGCATTGGCGSSPGRAPGVTTRMPR